MLDGDGADKMHFFCVKNIVVFLVELLLETLARKQT